MEFNYTMFMKDLFYGDSDSKVSLYLIDRAIDRLELKDKRMAQVIKLYYSGWTLKKIAGIIENRSKNIDKKFGVTREQARHILLRSMRRLRHQNYWE
jgi:DNA-directed RNA polymerase sigma subunit (sigma70/sigma32)